MKPALIALIAVLSPLCATAAPSVEQPGPHRLGKTQMACQNLADANDLFQLYAPSKPAIAARYVATRDTPEHEAMRRACINIPKGTEVMVRKRWINLECVDIRNRPSTGCFYTERVSSVRYEDKGYLFYMD